MGSSLAPTLVSAATLPTLGTGRRPSFAVFGDIAIAGASALKEAQRGSVKALSSVLRSFSQALGPLWTTALVASPKIQRSKLNKSSPNSPSIRSRKPTGN